MTPRIRLVLLVAAVLGAVIGLSTLWVHLTLDPMADIRAYHDAASRLNRGEPLYAEGDSMEYFYPPLLATLLRPFVVLPYPVFATAWEALMVAAFAVTLWRLGIRRRATWLAVGILGAPIAWTLSVGQAQALVTLFVSFGSPLGIALAAQLKIFPALIVLYWIGRRAWRSVGRFVAWSVTLVLVQLITEPRGFIDFLAVTNLERVGQDRNVSVYAVSPVLWGAFVVVGLVTVLVLSRTRWGWSAAVVFSTVATPRLLMYMLMTLIAALDRPVQPGGARVTGSASLPDGFVRALGRRTRRHLDACGRQRSGAGTATSGYPLSTGRSVDWPRCPPP